MLSCLSLLSVSFMAFHNPQSVMDLVSVKLTNNDAISSIRGVYGGVGLTLVAALLYTLRKNLQESLGLLSILWGLYAMSRILTLFMEGPLGSFGKQWLVIETTFFVMATVLYVLARREANTGNDVKTSARSRKKPAIWQQPM